jgi:hypothetical protein
MVQERLCVDWKFKDPVNTEVTLFKDMALSVTNSEPDNENILPL